MAIPAVVKYHIEKFWDEEYRALDYVQEPFNDPITVAAWVEQGWTTRFTGDLCDMRHRLPKWADRFIDIYTQLGWKDIGLAFYRMSTGTVLPTHQDLYRRYIELFDLQGQESSIRRALVLLEDWSSGHYLEVDGHAYVHWYAGDTVEWRFDTPHMAANLGTADRYTLQITGHV